MKGREEERKRERERLRLYIQKGCDLTHIQQNLLVYIIKVGSPAYPKGGCLKGWIKEGEIIPHNPICFLHLIIKTPFIHEIPKIKHEMRLFLGSPCQVSNTPYR